MPTSRQQFVVPGGLDVSAQANQIAANNSPDISNFVIETGRLKTAPGLAKSTTNPLMGGQPCDTVFVWRELDGTVHRLASTLTRIYEINDDGTATRRTTPDIWLRPGWVPMVDYPGWFHAATHGNSYRVVAGRGGAPLYYWDAQSYDFQRLRITYNDYSLAELWPIASTMFWNRLCVLSPVIIDVDGGEYNEHGQRFMWSKINDMTDWDNGNAGWTDLVDTGGQNVAMKQMACNMVVYQDNSIWNIQHVGGTDVFRPVCALTDYGLYGSRLVQAVGQVHYFVNKYDSNVYRYQGGTVRPQVVGNNIWPNLRDDLQTAIAYPNRHFMLYEPPKNRLWIFVCGSAGGCVKAYFLDLDSGEWSVRDYSAYITTPATKGLLGGCYDGQTDKALLLSSADGYVFDQQTANTADVSTPIAAYRISAEFDGGQPDVWKKYDTLAFEAKGATSSDTAVVAVKVDGGSGLPSTWDTLGTTISLSTSWKKYRVPLQSMGGYKIQVKLANSSGEIIEVRSFREPSFEPVREK